MFVYDKINPYKLILGGQHLKQNTLLTLLSQNTDIMTILTIIDSLNLNDSWLCAGTLRNFLWNYLSGLPTFDHQTDVDVIFFDATISYEQTLALEKQLLQNYPVYRWELKNQAYMHTHSPHSLPYLSSQEAITKFPETCTAIGAKLQKKTKIIELFTPFGLADIEQFIVQPTPYFCQDSSRLEVYQNRLLSKKWHEKWPAITYKK